MLRTVLTTLALALPAIAGAQEAAEGRVLFAQHCAACHGIDAAGQGPMAAILTLQPTDLTRLSVENEGVFPTERVVFRIDGRDPLVAHGSPMPIFGPFFEGTDATLQAETGQPILTSRAVADLVAYIETVQGD